MMNFAKKITILGLALSGVCVSAPAIAADFSPTLLIESAPSDNPAYRRMVYVKYLQGSHVTASYKAYNRREFLRADNTTPPSMINNCANGNATSLRDIKSFQKHEARLKRSGQKPVAAAFCIKNVSNWSAKNKDVYLDPIFETMPYVKGQR